MKKIPLTQNKFAIVDDDDFEYLSQFSWHFQSRGYAASNSKKLMHRVICNPEPKQQIDHINGNKLDNRRSNLRLCSNSQNHMNKPKSHQKTSSKYKGVYWCKHKKKWRVTVKFNKKKIHIGDYKNEKDAGMAYNNAAINIFKEFACLNMIEGEHD